MTGSRDSGTSYWFYLSLFCPLLSGTSKTEKQGDVGGRWNYATRLFYFNFLIAVDVMTCYYAVAKNSNLKMKFVKDGMPMS